MIQHHQLVQRLIAEQFARNPRSAHLNRSDAGFHQAVTIAASVLEVVADELDGSSGLGDWFIEDVLRTTVASLITDRTFELQDVQEKAAGAFILKNAPASWLAAQDRP